MTLRTNVAQHLRDKDIHQLVINLEGSNLWTVSRLQAIGITRQMVERDGEVDAGDLHQMLIRFFSEDHDERRRILLENRPSLEGMAMNPVVRSGLLAFGIDPIDAATLSLWTGNALELEFDDGVEITFYFNQKTCRGSATLHLGAVGTWEYEDDTTSSLETGLRIPETLKPSLPGRMLRDVISHPVLDAHDLIIEDVSDAQFGDGTSIRLRTPTKVLSTA